MRLHYKKQNAPFQSSQTVVKPQTTWELHSLKLTAKAPKKWWVILSFHGVSARIFREESSQSCVFLSISNCIWGVNHLLHPYLVSGRKNPQKLKLPSLRLDRLPPVLCRDPLVPTAGEAAPGQIEICGLWVWFGQRKRPRFQRVDLCKLKRMNTKIMVGLWK